MFSTLMSQLVSVFKDDANKVMLPLVIAFLQSIQNDMSAINVTVQLAKFNANLLAALPGIAHDEVAALVTFLGGLAHDASPKA